MAGEWLKAGFSNFSLRVSHPASFELTLWPYDKAPPLLRELSLLLRRATNEASFPTDLCLLFHTLESPYLPPKSSTF